jgi:hypothetical protein
MIINTSNIFIVKYKMNPELKIGDRVVLLYMENESSVLMGEKGTVIHKSNVFGDDQYNIEWDNGSKLSLLDCCDKWDTVENFEKRILNKIKKKDIIENDESDFNKKMLANIDVFVHFKMKFFQKYLIMVRNSGIINMFGASPYLYVGRQKIEEEMSYKDLEGEQYDEMLENADKSRDLMIQGTVSFLEKTGKEVSVENVKRFLPRFATKIVENYMFLY